MKLEGQLDTHELKRKIQDQRADGFVTIVGPGLSCAEGLSGMGALAKRLKDVLPALVSAEHETAWAEVAAQLNAGEGLERALPLARGGST